MYQELSRRALQPSLHVIFVKSPVREVLLSLRYDDTKTQSISCLVRVLKIMAVCSLIIELFDFRVWGSEPLCWALLLPFSFLLLPTASLLFSPCLLPSPALTRQFSQCFWSSRCRQTTLSCSLVEEDTSLSIEGTLRS